MTRTNPTPAQLLVSLLLIGWAGYNIVTPLFLGDRAVVGRCIDAMLDASRGRVGYGDLQDAKRRLDAATEVIITLREDIQLAGGSVTNLDYTLDGRSHGMICEM